MRLAGVVERESDERFEELLGLTAANGEMDVARLAVLAGPAAFSVGEPVARTPAHEPAAFVVSHPKYTSSVQVQVPSGSSAMVGVGPVQSSPSSCNVT